MAKRAAKKTTKAKSKPVAKKPAKKPGLSTLPPLKTCLKGNRIALAGRFSSPNKSAIEKFYKSFGATIAKTVDGKLDILLVGSGQVPTGQTKAEKLNASGGAKILITDHPILAFPDFRLNQIEYLTSPDQVVLFSEIIQMNRSFKSYSSQIGDVDFSKETIGPDRLPKNSNEVKLLMNFHKCCFDQTTFQNVTLNAYFDHSYNCELNGSIFNNAGFSYLNQFTFNKCKGSSLKLVRAKDCQLNGMVLDKIELSNTDKISISDSKFKVFEVSKSVNNYFLENVKIGLWRARDFDISSCRITSSEFSKVTVAGTEITEAIKCVGSTFKDCKFSDLDLESVEFVECELINCTFDGLKTVDLNFCEKQNSKTAIS